MATTLIFYLACVTGAATLIAALIWIVAPAFGAPARTKKGYGRVALQGGAATLALYLMSQVG
jgi:hypothetical protein